MIVEVADAVGQAPKARQRKRVTGHHVAKLFGANVASQLGLTGEVCGDARTRPPRPVCER